MKHRTVKGYSLKPGADLSGADLSGADLSGVCLSGAELYEARGIISFGPVGATGRIGYAVRGTGPNTVANVKLGCFWGTLEEACVEIQHKYGQGSSYEMLVRAAVAELIKGS